MNIAENNAQQAGDQSPETTQAAGAAENAAMDEAAKEASMMLLDRVLAEDTAKVQETAKDAEDASGQQEQQQPQEPTKKAPRQKQAAKAQKAADEPQQPNGSDSDGREEPRKEEPSQKPKRKPLSAERIADIAAKTTAETLRQMEEHRMRVEQQRKDEAAKAQRDEEQDYPEEVKRDVERLKEVQRLHPADYRGRDLAKEFVESAVKEHEYERDWRRKNPGVEFDWNDEEHASFIADNAVEVDESHLTEADTSLIKEAAIREAEERFSKKYGADIEELRRARAEADLAPVRAHVDRTASTTLLESVRPDLVEKLESDPKAVIEEVRNDPIAVEAVQAVERWSVPALDAAVRVINNPSGYKSDSPTVRLLAEAALRAESIIASVPREERPVSEDGRRFSTLRDYANMPASQRAKYYTIQEESLVAGLIIKAAAQEAKTIKEGLEKKAESYAKRMGFTRNESSTSQIKPQNRAESTLPQRSAPSVKAQPSVPDVPKDEAQTANGLPKQFWESIGLPL